MLTLALFAALLGCVAHTVWFWFRTISFPFPVDYREGPLLEQAVRLGHGLSIYRIPASEPPWLIGSYPPLFPLLNSLWERLFGPAYWYGRMTSAASAVGAALFAGVLPGQPDLVCRRSRQAGADPTGRAAGVRRDRGSESSALGPIDAAVRARRPRDRRHRRQVGIEPELPAGAEHGDGAGRRIPAGGVATPSATSPRDAGRPAGPGRLAAALPASLLRHHRRADRRPRAGAEAGEACRRGPRAGAGRRGRRIPAAHRPTDRAPTVRAQPVELRRDGGTRHRCWR